MRVKIALIGLLLALASIAHTPRTTRLPSGHSLSGSAGDGDSERPDPFAKADRERERSEPSLLGIESDAMDGGRSEGSMPIPANTSTLVLNRETHAFPFVEVG